METLAQSPFLLIGLGFMVGTLGGFFGIGGAFIMTPMLNLLGFPMVYAIGTDLTLMFGNAMVASMRHLRFGHVDLRLALFMLLGTAPGVYLGKRAVFALDALGVADSVIRYIYVVLLFGLALFMLRDYFRHAKANGERFARAASRRVWRRLRIGLHIDFPVSRLHHLSVWMPIGIGLATGFLAALLGVGGGFIRMPALLYGLGVPTTVAIGTDLFEVVFSSAIGSYLYALEGKADLPAAMTMLLGATIGAQVGAYATLRVEGMRIRLFFALTIMAAGIAAALKQSGEVLEMPILSNGALILMLVATIAMTLFLVLRLLLSGRVTPWKGR